MSDRSMRPVAVGHEIGKVGYASYRPNPMHVAIAHPEDEMVAVFRCTDVPSHTRMGLEQRLRELKIKAGVRS